MQKKYIWQLQDWTSFTWKSENLIKLLGEARAVQSQLLTKMEGLGLNNQQEAHQQILIEETISTAKIEGEKYERSSVRSSLAKHLGLPSRKVDRVEPHIDGLVQVLLDATQNYKQLLTKDRLWSWNAALFPTGYSGLYKIETGQWRAGSVAVVSGAIGREEIHYQAPPAEKVVAEMDKFLSWWEGDSKKLEGLLRAAIAHFWFVMIHPFADGNGRITRVLTEMALAQDEQSSTRYYSLSSQIIDERNKYYDILQQTQVCPTISKIAQPDITSWLEWFLETFIKAIKKSEVTIGHVLAKAEFWQCYMEVSLNDKQRKVINKLLDVGKGNFKGGLTTRKYAAMTKVSKATAFRELDDLLEKNVLKRNPGQGRSVSYDLKW